MARIGPVLGENPDGSGRNVVCCDDEVQARALLDAHGRVSGFQQRVAGLEKQLWNLKDGKCVLVNALKLAEGALKGVQDVLRPKRILILEDTLFEINKALKETKSR